MSATFLSSHVIILDLDGTLVDSAPDLAAAMNFVIEAEGLAPLPAGDVRQLVGQGARALLIKGFAHYGRIDISEQLMDGYVHKFIEHYRDHLTESSSPFPGCTEFLKWSQKHDAKLAVCTNKLEDLTFPLLEQLGLLDFFDAVICRDTLPVYKPDPLPLKHCVEVTRSKHGIMVGDTSTDLNAAIAAGMPCCIADFGYGNSELWAQKKARIFSSFEDLPDLIKSLAGADLG